MAISHRRPQWTVAASLCLHPTGAARRLLKIRPANLKLLRLTLTKYHEAVTSAVEPLQALTGLSKKEHHRTASVMLLRLDQDCTI
ncbi:hypothetical protein [Neokomagataea tanensis]|uniref:hypothetical protein n=1 Tax=Neokomagataea TaxID=1223423 RepID=UPI001143AAA2|nr:MULTISPECIES: hypothetical protein [Neokomagataea]